MNCLPLRGAEGPYQGHYITETDPAVSSSASILTRRSVAIALTHSTLQCFSVSAKAYYFPMATICTWRMDLYANALSEEYIMTFLTVDQGRNIGQSISSPYGYSLYQYCHCNMYSRAKLHIGLESSIRCTVSLAEIKTLFESNIIRQLIIKRRIKLSMHYWRIHWKLSESYLPNYLPTSAFSNNEIQISIPTYPWMRIQAELSAYLSVPIADHFCLRWDVPEDSVYSNSPAQPQLPASRKEDHESKDYVRMKEESVMLPVVHVEKLGIMHSRVGVLTTSVANIIASIVAIIFILYILSLFFCRSLFSYVCNFQKSQGIINILSGNEWHYRYFPYIESCTTA